MEYFPYLKQQEINEYQYPRYVLITQQTEQHSFQYSSDNPVQFEIDTDPVGPSTLYDYDMTRYIRNPQLRYQDSLIMAKWFDSQWSRFKQKIQPSTDYPDIIFSDTFHGARKCFQFLKTPQEIFSFYFQILKIKQPNSIPNILQTSIQIVIPFFSHLKAEIHNKIDQLPPISYCYQELDTIAGYPLDKNRSLNDDPTKWLSVDVPDFHNKEWWFKQIYSLLLRSRNTRTTLEPLLSFGSFLDSPWLWTTDGATPYSTLFLDKKKVNTKFGAAVSLNHQELMATIIHALNPKTANIDIFIKQDERGFKRRLIANMDLGSYLIAAYIRYLLEWMDGPVPHWMTSTTTPKQDYNIIEYLRQGKRAIPLDESQFDHHLSRNAWLGFLKALDFLFPNNFGVHLFHALFANSTFFDRSSFKRGIWMKGMPSGLAITSIGNTMFNYVKQQFIPSPIHFALGDDVLLFNDEISLDSLSKYYETYGAEINIKKNWTSHKYAEYLHFLYSQHGRVGLPARMYGTLIFALQFKDATPLQRLNELMMSMKDFFDRACIPLPEDLVAADLSRAVSSKWAGFSKEVAKIWMHIPKALNGFGLIPYVYKNFKIDNLEIKKQEYTGSKIQLPSVNTIIKSQFRLLPFKFHKTSYHLGNILHLPPINSVQEWEDRLNMKCEGFSSKEVEYASQTIPLPEIPFLSTARVSSLATLWKYNAYPNIRGNAVSLTNRFISASLGLINAITEWQMTRHVAVYV